jgi:hypothetical protein
MPSNDFTAHGKVARAATEFLCTLSAPSQTGEALQTGASLAQDERCNPRPRTR